MKTRTESILFQFLVYGNSMLLAIGLSRVFLATNGITVPFLHVVWPVILVHAAFKLLLSPPLRAMITLSALTLMSLLMYLLWPGRVASWRPDLIELGNKSVYAFQYYTGFASLDEKMIPFAATAAIVLVSYLVCLTATKIQLPLVWAIVLLVLMTLNALRDVSQDAIGILLTAFSILLLMVKRQPFRKPGRKRPFKRQPVTAMMVAAPLILLSILGSLLLTAFIPVRMGRQQQLIEGLADDVSQAMGFEPATELQPDFSISFAGFYPLGTRLGGPVALSESPVMDVFGHPGPALLRGAIYDRYDGARWERDPRGETFRLDNIFEQEVRQIVFDLDQPDPDVVNERVVMNLIDEWNLVITPRATASGMIFTPGRPLAVTPQTDERFQVYFDDRGMLYSKYPLTAKTPYRVESRVVRTWNPEFPDYALQVHLQEEEGADVRPAFYEAEYLAVPDNELYRSGGELQALADHLTSGAEDPYGKALAIRRYLIEHATYNLNVAVPPEDKDFVLWFLESREGYCVYFATAQVMLSRLAGIPARYAEGFILDDPDPATHARTVMANRAHAWCEIYIPLIGWVPIDATPGGVAPGGQEDPAEPTPVPTGPVEPEPSISPLPTGPDELPDPMDAEKRRAFGIRLLRLAAIALAILFVRYAIRHREKLLYSPEDLAILYPDAVKRLEIYWQELQLALQTEAQLIRPGETPILFLDRLKGPYPHLSETLDEAGQIVSAVRYGRHQPTERELAILAKLYRRVDRMIREKNRFNHLLLNRLIPRLRGVDGRRRLMLDHLIREARLSLGFGRKS